MRTSAVQTVCRANERWLSTTPDADARFFRARMQLLRERRVLANTAALFDMSVIILHHGPSLLDAAMSRAHSCDEKRSLSFLR